MIKRLKIKFGILTMLSLFALLSFIVTGMNILNFISIVQEADDTLQMILQDNDFVFDLPKDKEFSGNDNVPPSDIYPIDDNAPPKDNDVPRRDGHPKILHESRYFSVVMNNEGEILFSDGSQILPVDEEDIDDYAYSAMKENSSKGFIDDFRYLKTEERDNIRITFLDCGRKLNAYTSFLIISIVMALAGFLIVIFAISFFAGRIIRPIAESYEKQKRCITDAGHELKTPLTIINANVDILAMDLENNESLSDIKQQTKRLTDLTNNLVSLARMEESENNLQMIEFPASEVVREAAKPFKTLAKARGMRFTCIVQPMLSMHGNDKAIEQLVSILLDNAFKYSPSDSSISLDLVKQNRNLILTVFNYTESVITQEDIRYVFDRFYRTDSSRNSETGGHGIGLSVAKAIVTAHGGKINAYTNGGHSFKIVVTLPVI